MNKKIHQTDYAYFAGYIDGDGCFHIGTERSKRRLDQKPVISIVISSVNVDVLNEFKKFFGGSVSMVSEAHANSKSLYQYSIKKRNTLKLAEYIFPYLVEKKDECLATINFAKSQCVQEKDDLIRKMKILKDVSSLVSIYHKEEFERFRNTVEPCDEDCAYFAGFIDAECCLGIQKYKPKDRPNNVYKIQLQLNNTKAPVFKWILERFGGRIHFVNRVKHQKCRKNQLTWRLSGKALSKILPKIHPFLKHKKPVCEELIKFYETTLPNGGARHTEKFRSQYAAVIKTREEIVSSVHQLNLKGIKPN